MPTITDYLKYANLQMAAEALYGFDANKNPAIAPGSVLDTSNGPLQIQVDWLTTGNRHASKFTASEAAKLSADWVVVERP